MLRVGERQRPRAHLALEDVLNVILAMDTAGTGPWLRPEVGERACSAELERNEVVQLVRGEGRRQTIAAIRSRLICPVTDTGERTTAVYPDRQMVDESVSGVTRGSVSRGCSWDRAGSPRRRRDSSRARRQSLEPVRPENRRSKCHPDVWR